MGAEMELTVPIGATPTFDLAPSAENDALSPDGSAIVDYMLNPPASGPRAREGLQARTVADPRETALRALIQSAFAP